VAPNHPQQRHHHQGQDDGPQRHPEHLLMPGGEDGAELA
jgi:hypothetical protein